LSLRGRKYHENGANCTMMICMIIIRALNLRGGGCDGGWNLVSTAEKGNVYSTFVGRPEGRGPLGR